MNNLKTDLEQIKLEDQFGIFCILWLVFAILSGISFAYGVWQLGVVNIIISICCGTVCHLIVKDSK